MTDHDTTTAAGSGAEPDDRALVVRQHVAAPPETVFDFLVEPDKVATWLGVATEIDAKAGGSFWMDANGQDIASGRYVEVIRPERVVFTFGWEASPDVPAGSTTVTICLEPVDDGTTMIELRHVGLPGGPEDQHHHGWTFFLDRLATAATGGDLGPPVH